MNLRIAVLAGLGVASLNAFAVDVGEYFQNGAGDIVRIDSMHHAHSHTGDMADLVTIEGSDGHEYTQHDAYSTANFRASRSRDYIAVDVPARTRAESSRVEIKLISEVVINKGGEVQAYVVDETSGRSVLQADELKIKRAQVVGEKDITRFIRSRPSRSVVDLTLGSLVELHQRLTSNNDGTMVKIVEAAESRPNYRQSKLAKTYLNTFYSSSVHHVSKLAEMLKQDALADAAKLQGDVGITGTGGIAAKAVEAAEGAR